MRQRNPARPDRGCAAFCELRTRGGSRKAATSNLGPDASSHAMVALRRVAQDGVLPDAQGAARMEQQPIGPSGPRRGGPDAQGRGRRAAAHHGQPIGGQGSPGGGAGRSAAAHGVPADLGQHGTGADLRRPPRHRTWNLPAPTSSTAASSPWSTAPRTPTRPVEPRPKKDVTDQPSRRHASRTLRRGLPSLAPIHPTPWKGCSTNFGRRGF